MNTPPTNAEIRRTLECLIGTCENAAYILEDQDPDESEDVRDICEEARAFLARLPP